jgi:hypothetical protein
LGAGGAGPSLRSDDSTLRADAGPSLLAS